MANTNYINPAAFAPQVPQVPMGIMSGAMRYDQMQKYEDLMRNQMAMQEMQRKQAEMDLEKRRAGLPLEEIGRQIEMERRQAELPMAGQATRSKLENEISKADWERTVERGPEARNAAIRKALDQVSASDLAKLSRNTSVVRRILEEGMPHGPEVGSRIIQQRIEEARKLGYEVPDAIANPATWKQAYDGIVSFDVEHRRKLAEQEARARADLEKTKVIQQETTKRTGIMAAATRDAATTRASTTSAKIAGSIDAQINKTIDMLRGMDKDSPEYEQLSNELTFNLQRAFERDIPKNPGYDLEMKKAAAAGDEKAMQGIKEKYLRQYIQEKFGGLGASRSIGREEKPEGQQKVLKFDSKGNLLQ